MRFKAVEDNGGGLSLYVFDGHKVIYASDGHEYRPGSLSEDIQGLVDGDDPRKGWEPNVDDPQAAWDAIARHQYGWEVVAEGQTGKLKLYKHKMGAAACLEFNVSDDDRDRAWAAAQLGATRSKRKARSSAENGRLGGRPRITNER